MTFHIKIMVAHQHDQSIFTWGKLPPLLLCMRMSRLTHKKGERIKKRKSCQPFLSANKEESAVGQITDVLPHKNDHYCAKILSDFLACFHSELCHKRFWQACPSIRQTHTMRDSVRAQAVPTWWPSPGRPVAVHAAKTVNTKPSICSLTGSMELQHRQPC